MLFNRIIGIKMIKQLRLLLIKKIYLYAKFKNGVPMI